MRSARATRRVLARRAAVVILGFGFGSARRRLFLLGGTALIDLMTASPEVRVVARDYLVYAALAPVTGVFAFAYDGIYIGATWTRDMRNLMVDLAAHPLLRGLVADAARSAIPACGSRSWRSSARGRCRRRAIRRWCG